MMKQEIEVGSIDYAQTLTTIPLVNSDDGAVIFTYFKGLTLTCRLTRFVSCSTVEDLG